ncbi:MAG: hypothetical protein IJT25_00720 [Clostridia bacterium]|nr:hypothetical protein [Clostridia bacterium]
MKKLIKNISILFFISFRLFNILYFNTSLSYNVYAMGSSEQESVYAKANSGCLFFKSDNTSNLSYENIYFEIPKSYFVFVLESSEKYLKVRYLNFIGYCLPQSVSLVSFTPTTPFLTNVSLNIKTSSSTQMRFSPTISNSNTVTDILAGTENIEYIASLSGEIPEGGTSSIWYYAKYTPKNSPTEIFYGYIYSERASLLSDIPLSTESENLNTPNEAPTTLSAESEYENVEISSTLKAVLIALICVPIVVIFLVILIKNKHNHKKLELNNNAIAQNLNNNSNNLNSNIKSKTPIKLFKDKTFYKKHNTNSKIFETPKLSLEDLDIDEDDNLL